MNYVKTETENKSIVVPVLTYSRVSGYYNPTIQFNRGKLEEFKERKTLKIPEYLK